MITFKQFVQSLGEHAKTYTPEELRRLHVEVRKMARVLLAVWYAQNSAELVDSDDSSET